LSRHVSGQQLLVDGGASYRFLWTHTAICVLTRSGRQNNAGFMRYFER
jgi:hypothetical protein